MNINVPAMKKNASATTAKFNETTHDLDLRHAGFNRDAFEQVGNGLRLVMKDGAIVFGLVDALDNEDAPVVRPKVSLRYQKAYVSGFCTLMRRGLDGYAPGYHPFDRDNQEGYVVTGLVRQNYKGTEFNVPEDGEWHEVVRKPVVGHYVRGKSYADSVGSRYASIKHDAMDIILSGHVVLLYWPGVDAKKGSELNDWLSIMLGHNQAVLDGDDELVAIYEARKSESTERKKLNRKAAKTISQQRAEKKAGKEVEATRPEDITMRLLNGEELNLSQLKPKSVVKLVDHKGRFKTSLIWNPGNEYAVESMKQAAYSGWKMQILL